MAQETADVYFDNGTLTVDFSNITYKNEHIIYFIQIDNSNVLNLTCRKTNYVYVKDLFDKFKYSLNTEQLKAKDEYFEQVLFKPKWYELWKSPYHLNLPKLGWVELKEELPQKNYKTTNYRLIR